jgi:dUTPase
VSSKSDAVLLFIILIEKIKTPESEPSLRFVKLTQNDVTVTQESNKAKGFKLRSAGDTIIHARRELLKQTSRYSFQMDVTVTLHLVQDWHCSTILMWEQAGVTDDYRGNVGEILFNHSEKHLFFFVTIVLHKLLMRKYIILN